MKQEQGEEEDKQRKGKEEKSRVKVYGGGIRIIMSADTEAIDNLKQQQQQLLPLTKIVWSKGP